MDGRYDQCHIQDLVKVLPGSKGRDSRARRRMSGRTYLEVVNGVKPGN